MNNVLNFIKSLNIDKSNPVVIACSGGPDSMFLLTLMKNLGYNCICAHVNHNVREESKDEYLFLENFCHENDIIFEGTEIKEYNKDNFHNDAHNFRYKFFKSCLDKYNSKYLFTAHHGDDLMETILMRLLRGTTLNGYKGFDIVIKNDDYTTIRPLVFLTKEEILKYDTENNIPYVTDESNNTDHYTRNRIRHNVLPALKTENENVHMKFLDFSLNLKNYMSFIDSFVDKIIKNVYHNNVLNVLVFNEQHEVIQKEILYRVFKELYENDLNVIDDVNVLDIINLAHSNKPNMKVSLPLGIEAKRNYDEIIFDKITDELDSYRYELTDEVITPLGKFKIIENSDEKSNYTIRLSINDISKPLIIEPFKTGEKMMVKNLNGSKKISDIFIDAKINSNKRKTWPILKDGDGKILWIPGLKKSVFDRPEDSSYDIIIKYEEGKEK